MWSCFTDLLLTIGILVSHTDGQYWGNHQRGGYVPPSQTNECPVDEGQTFRCLPRFQCPRYQARFNSFNCAWDGGPPLVCCQTPPAEQGCGLLHGASAAPKDRLFAAIIGGIPLREATTTPWMAAVGERLGNGSVDWYCGGTLINAYTVVTAAHCLLRRKAQMVRVGELDLSRSNEPHSYPEDVHVASTTIHPAYRLPSYYNDIALLHLAKPVRLNKYVKAVCVADNTAESYVGKSATLTGWGHLEFGGDRSAILQEVSVTVWNNSDCKRTYAPPRVPLKNYPQGIVDSQLCAGDPQGGKDACQGDSGGPLVVKTGNTHTLIGVVSSGIGCGAKSFPGVYSRVSTYADWINSNVKAPVINKPQRGGYSGPSRYNNNHRGNPFFCSGYNSC